MPTVKQHKEPEEGKHAGGRPTVYSAATLDQAREYLDQAKDSVEFHTSDNGKFHSTSVDVRLPTVEGLAVRLGVSRETLYAWARDAGKGEFSDIIERLRAEQAERLINQGLAGNYNATIAKLLLAKHGYKDERKEEHAVDPELRELIEKANRILPE